MTFTPPQLPSGNIVHKVYELYVYLYHTVALFPKRDRYTLGARLEQNILNLLELLILAESKDSSSKLLILKKSDHHIQVLKMMVRMAHEVKAMPQSRYINNEEKLLEVGRMLGGWIKQTKLKRPPSEPS